MEMTSELIPEMSLELTSPELTSDQAEIGDPDGCPLTAWVWVWVMACMGMGMGQQGLGVHGYPSMCV